MGHRMEFYVNESIASEIISIARSFQIEAQIIGFIEPNNGKKVTIRSKVGTFEY
jgi:phosphoribosylformylglycinamidine cyclo-ligase